MSTADAVTVALDVEVDPDVAFEVFTQELDQWWGRGPRFRFVAPYGGTLRLEPGVGGRLLHVADADVTFVVGRVLVWEPPHRLALTWRLTNFTPEQDTRLEVRFDRVPVGTRVTVTHSGWDALAPDHPARHGLTGREFVRFKGGWWADLLTALKRHAEHRRPAGKETP